MSKKSKYMEKIEKQARNKSYVQKKRQKYEPEKQPTGYKMIDFNITYYPYGYCLYHKGWLTVRMAKCHNCKQKNCKRFVPFSQYQEMKNNTIES